jgi:iron-sulfur cluster assembly protein
MSRLSRRFRKRASDETGREKVAPIADSHLVVPMESFPATLPLVVEPGSDVLPGGVREGNEKLIYLTPAAGAKAQALMARESRGEFLRVAITGGGCNGLSYKMKFVPEPKRGDILVRTSGTRVVVDSKTALYLKGTHLDYSSALVAGGFKFSNPNAKASCSCGESFSV